jgi:hypothetical protein
MRLDDLFSIMLRNKDSEDNGVALFFAHEESMLSWNRSCLLKQSYRCYPNNANNDLTNG